MVENARYVNPREPVDPIFFLPYLQMLPAEWTNSALARSNFVQDIELRIDPAARDLRYPDSSCIARGGCRPN